METILYKAENQNKSGNLILLVLVILPIILTLYATTKNLGVSPDSIVYIGVAKNISLGNGFLMPVTMQKLTHYPPLYPIILTPGWLLNIDITSWAKLINLILFPSSILIIGLISKSKRIINFWIPALLFATNPAINEIHKFAWSEPPFILFLIFAVYFSLIYLDKKDIKFLILSSLLFSTASFTRYIGVSIIGGFLFFFLFFEKLPLKKLLVIGVISLPPALFMILNTIFKSSDQTNRYLSIKQNTSQELIILFGMLLIFCLIIGLVWKKQIKEVLLISIINLFYLFMLAFTVLFFDSTPVDYRLLSPVYSLSFILIGLIQNKIPKNLKKYFTFLILAWVIGQIVLTGYWAIFNHQIGLPLSDGTWGKVIPPHNWRSP